MAPLVRTGGSRHTGLAAPPHRNIHMSSENFMRIVDALEIPLSYLLYEKLNEIPLTELIKNVLYDRSEKQKEHLLHMLEEMAKGMDRLI